MELTPVISNDLDHHVRRYKHREEYKQRVIQVIEMASNGCTIEEIRTTVKMSQGNIGSAKRWGRQRGLC